MIVYLQKAVKNKRSKRSTRKIRRDQIVDKNSPVRLFVKKSRSLGRMIRKTRSNTKTIESLEIKTKNAVVVETISKDHLPIRERPNLDNHSLSKANKSIKKKEQRS